MSQALSAPASTEIDQIVNSALSEYEKETGNDLSNSWPAKKVHRPGSVPTCLIPSCGKPVVKDLRTNELTEYCGEAHMRFVVSCRCPLWYDCTRVLNLVLVRSLAKLC